MTNSIRQLQQEAAALAKADWIGTPPDDDWYRLTSDEQQRYIDKVCQQLGVTYKAVVFTNRITLVAELPDSLSLRNMPSDEQRNHEAYLTRKLEEAVTWILRGRDQGLYKS